MKNILVPTDFSTCAQEAVELAEAVALACDAKLYFLHLFDVYADFVETPEILQPVGATRHVDVKEGHARDNMDRLINHAEDLDIEAVPIFVYDKGNEKVTNYIKDYQIDFIIMGSHGAKGFRELFVGSTAQYVVEHSDVPVLVVKKSTDLDMLNTIMFASTFRSDMSQSVKRVVDFAQSIKAEVAMYYVNHVDHKVTQQEAIHKLQEYMKPYKEVAYTTGVIETNDEEWGIHEYIKLHDYHLVSISREEHEGRIKLFSKNIAKSLVNHEHVPVLVV